MFVVTCALALETWALCVMSRSYAHWRPAMMVKDEPRAHALYDTMVRTLHQARSLSYRVAVYNEPGPRVSHYQIDLKKPHACRITVSNGMTGKTTTLISGDQWLWVTW